MCRRAPPVGPGHAQRKGVHALHGVQPGAAIVQAVGWRSAGCTSGESLAICVAVVCIALHCRGRETRGDARRGVATNSASRPAMRRAYSRWRQVAPLAPVAPAWAVSRRRQAGRPPFPQSGRSRPSPLESPAGVCTAGRHRPLRRGTPRFAALRYTARLDQLEEVVPAPLEAIPPPPAPPPCPHPIPPSGRLRGQAGP